MMCAMCVAHVTKAIEGCKGVKEVNVNLASSSALIEYDSDIISPIDIKKAVDSAGYVMVLNKKVTAAEQGEEKKN